MQVASRGRTGAGQWFDVGAAHRLPAVLASQLGVADVAAGPMAVQHGWAGLTGEPSVAPSGHHDQDVDELGTFLGQVIFVPRSGVIGSALEHAGVDEVVEALGQDFA